MTNIKTYEELSREEIYQIFRIRSEVFVVEQQCIYQDIVAKDLDAYHCFIKDTKGNIVAYLRLLKTGVSYKNGFSIGRVLVAHTERNKGYATSIMKTVIDYTFKDLDKDTIIISAQEYLVSFYTSLGFVTVGKVYLEDDIPHIEMILKR